MKQGILLLMALGFFALHSQAQIAYKDGDMFVIECAGMPAAAYTKTLKPRTTDGTNWAMGPNTEDNLGSAINNEKIAYKFEIAATNNSNTDWLSVVNLCAGLPGGNWRLPTLKELQLIYIMHEKLKSLSGFLPYTNSDQLSATENSRTRAWSVALYNVGHSQGVDKYQDYYSSRCIRDM